MYTYVAGTRSEPVPTTASFGTQAIAVPFGTAVAVPFGTAVAESERSPWEESCSGLRQDKEADAQAPAKFSRGAT